MAKAHIAFRPGELKNWNTYKSNHTLDYGNNIQGNSAEIRTGGTSETSINN
jgi:hypothetical protein